MRYRTSYTEDRTFKYVEICFLAVFFLLLFFIYPVWQIVTRIMQVFWMDFATAGVLFFYYSLHKSQYQIKYNLKITSLRVKIENKNLNAILDSKKFQNTEIWKAWARNGPVKWHFTWIAVLPQAKGPGNLIKLQSYNRLRTVDFWLTLFYIGLILGGFS